MVESLNSSSPIVPKPVAVEQPICCICTEPIVYYAIPETCNHNMVCWTCILKQRLKLSDEKCPMCKEPSDRVLITRDPNATLSNPSGKEIEDAERNLVFDSQDIWTDVRRKLGLFCSICPVEKMRKQCPTLDSLRDHIVK